MITYEGRSIPLISREQWHAREPKEPPQRISALRRREFIVHHSGGPASQSVRSIQDHCMDNRGFNDIDYNMLVDQQGAVYTGRGLSVVGAHAIGHNTIGYGVCVIGTNQLSGPARTAVRYLYSMCRDRSGHDLIVMGHSAVDQTQCPGDVIRTWMAHGWCNPRALLYDKRRQHMIGQDVRDVQRIVHAEPDGEFGPRTHARVRDWQAAHDLVADGIVGPLTRAGMGL